MQKIVQPVARPSLPSVRFTAFEVATTVPTATSTVHGVQMSTGSLKNGTMKSSMYGPTSGIRKSAQTPSPAITIWHSSLYRPGRPSRSL